MRTSIDVLSPRNFILNGRLMVHFHTNIPAGRPSPQATPATSSVHKAFVRDTVQQGLGRGRPAISNIMEQTSRASCLTRGRLNRCGVCPEGRCKHPTDLLSLRSTRRKAHRRRKLRCIRSVSGRSDITNDLSRTEPDT